MAGDVCDVCGGQSVGGGIRRNSGNELRLLWTVCQ